jgi:ribosome maturation factor RimP
MAKGKSKGKELIAQMESMAAPFIEQLELELVEVEYVCECGQLYLRFYIDKDQPCGVTIDDCSDLSQELSKKLDETDPIEEAYILEVSSPGLERPLKTERDFKKYKKEIVEVHLYKAIDKQKVFDGKLIGLIENDTIAIEDDSGETITFSKKDVSIVKRKIIF